MWATSAAAHTGERLIYIPYLSAEQIAEIDLTDGSVFDWEEQVGEPVLTALDFRTELLWEANRSDYEYDPSNLDFRIWLAWSTGGKLWVAGLFADDVWYEDVVSSGAYRFFYFSDSITIVVDGDHSGGSFVYFSESEDHSEHHPGNMRQAQSYEAIATLPGRQIAMSYLRSVIDDRWMLEEPFAFGGGEVFGKNPTFWAVECYVTAFDDLDVEGPEASRPSEFSPGKVIGISMSVIDRDDEDSGTTGVFKLRKDEAATSAIGADHLADAILLGAPDAEPTAVKLDSWARIKRTFR